MRISSVTVIYNQRIVHVLTLAIKTTTSSEYLLFQVHIILIPAFMEYNWSLSS
jgi:hypothetical protein